MDKYYIGAFITVGLFLLSHLGVAIWFASKMNSKVSEVSDSVKGMAQDIKQLAEVNTRLAVLEQRMARAEDDTREALKAAALLGRAPQ